MPTVIPEKTECGRPPWLPGPTVLGEAEAKQSSGAPLEHTGIPRRGSWSLWELGRSRPVRSPEGMGWLVCVQIQRGFLVAEERRL